MIKREGHSHTEFSPHGSGDDVELMIQKAIKLGFTEYSITEHAPLPPAFRIQYEGQETGFSEAAMAVKDLGAYFEKMNWMRDKYANQLKIHIGFEVDYLEDFEDWTRQFLDRYASQIDDSILSVHFMKGKNGHYWCVDDTTDDFAEGLLSQVSDSQELYQQYFSQIQSALRADLGKATPNRVGHITLIKKFQDFFRLDRTYSQTNQKLLREILNVIKRQRRELDFNVAGLYKPYCNEPYPSFELIKQVRKLEIPLVYGSDAHSIAEIGRGYNGIADFLA